MIDYKLYIFDIPVIEPERSPEIETVRHSSFDLRPDAPDFSPNTPSLDFMSIRDEEHVDIPDSDTSSVGTNASADVLSDDEFNVKNDVMPRGQCTFRCVYGSGDDLLNLRVYRCTKCGEDFDVCERCLSDGAHKPHVKYLKLWYDVK